MPSPLLSYQFSLPAVFNRFDLFFDQPCSRCAEIFSPGLRSFSRCWFSSRAESAARFLVAFSCPRPLRFPLGAACFADFSPFPDPILAAAADFLRWTRRSVSFPRCCFRESIFRSTPPGPRRVFSASRSRARAAGQFSRAKSAKHGAGSFFRSLACTPAVLPARSGFRCRPSC
jgi:hypothetical protein